RRGHGVLHGLAEADLAPGRLFCEWGRGFGVVACLAAMLDFDAWGIEIEGELVDAARQLAEDFDLPVEFVHGSFIPPGGAAHVESAAGFVWLSTEEGSRQADPGPDADELDLVFAYPWPDEERVLQDLFARYAAVGAR